MADGTLNFDTKIDPSGFESGANSIGNIVKGIGIEKAISGAVNKTMELGKASIEVGMGFEASMSQVAATMGITADQIANGSEDFEKLSAAAKEMGASTQFSASNASDALNYLALAGYSADDAIATLPTVLNLAAAGGMELGRASDMVTDAMSALGLKTNQSKMFVDKLAKTSQKSNTSVSQLGEAILTVGGTAKILKGGTTELNTVLGVLADNGKKGAEGGTVLRNMIMSLTNPTDNASKALTSLGISVFDAQGNMRELPQIIQELGGALDGMSDQQKQDIIGNIFNKADIGAVNSLLGTSRDRWDELSGEIMSSKDAAENMAETMNSNLKGSLTMLGSALEGLGIEIYETFSGSLKGAVDVATDCVSQIVAGMQENGVAGAIQAAGDIASGFLNGIMEKAPTLIQSGIAMVNNLIDGFNQNLPVIYAAAQNAIASFLEKVISALPKVVQTGTQMVAKLATGIIKNLPALITAAGNTMTRLVDRFMKVLPQLLQSGVQMVGKIASGLIQNMPAIIGAIAQVIAKLIATIGQNLPQFLSKGIEMLGQIATGIIQGIPKAVASIPTVISRIVSAFTGYSWSSIGSNIVSGIAGGITSAVGSVVEAAKGVAKSAIDAAKNLLGIHSPSKVFDWMGRMSDKGLALGFKNGMPATIRSMQNDLRKAVRSLDTDIAFTTSYDRMSGNVGSYNGIDHGNNMSRLIALQEEANRNASKMARRPIYLETSRIDRELPKGAVPVV